ncbi:MAG: hypothetical protein MJZ34_02745 [Paludibacteraceae bacterium]|nr:hypothetical protein [Paludibacteraceae bacterium]
MTKYSDALIKKDLYEEYKNQIDRYMPIEDVQREMQKYNMKYVLQQYLRVRNLCDQGIDDPKDVAEILGIPVYLAGDLINEYFLIPESMDKRTLVY